MEKMYSLHNALPEKSNMPSTKNENMFHSVFNLFSIIWEQFSKVPATLIGSINYPLSVTVVNNEGIIANDFFKNLTSKKDPMSIGNIYVLNAQIKESLNMVESIHSHLLDEKKPYIGKIFNEDTKDYFKFNVEYIDTKNRDTKSDKKNIECNRTICNDLVEIPNASILSEEELFEYIYVDKDMQKMSASKNCYNFGDSSSKGTSYKEQYSDCIITTGIGETLILGKGPSFSTPGLNALGVQLIQQSTVSTIFTNMFYRVFGGMTDRFTRANPVEWVMETKRSFSPKQRKKFNTVAKRRDRGRARSQLRRSGVSQTRHRKERTKHDIAVDIESDFKSWQELEMYHMGENKNSADCFNLDEDIIDGLETVQYIMEERINTETYTIADIKPKIQNLKKARRNVDTGLCKFSTKMGSIPECTTDANTCDHQNFFENRYKLQKSSFRPRLMSESSIDSEDSYCIVFETGSEVTYVSEFDDSGESDLDQTSEDEDTCKDAVPMSTVHKVKFNLNPEVRVMVQWDYAYRAARKGPWEEMARDRERFKGRINCIARVLNPILTMQHRTRVWQERFAHTE